MLLAEFKAFTKIQFLLSLKKQPIKKVIAIQMVLYSILH